MVDSAGMGLAHNRIDRAVSEANDAVTAEISALRAEIASIRSTLSDFGMHAYENVARSANQAADYVQDEATTVAGVIRGHPATTTTLMALIGGIGFAIGYLVASTSMEQKQAWYSRYC
ncbi:hypothetical protein [Rhizobium sp. FY34]|uniref:hypothetical protein n=1 Tax=Rhizobium sp. FY34 TaxID=2562309 RepID=UPI0010C0FF3D|nr:hypothetical protein [Rhizobium sp. FY34]